MTINWTRSGTSKQMVSSAALSVPRAASAPGFRSVRCRKTNPQNFDLCSSFAIVSLHTVTGNVSMRDVKMERNGDDFEVDPADDPTFVPDFTVSLVPKEGENFGGERVSSTTAEEDDDDTDLDEESEFKFEDVAAGAYSVVDPSGWGARVFAVDSDGEIDMTPAGVAIESSVDPIGSDVHISIRPTTLTFYGHVVGADDFAVADVTVNVNGESAMTDEAGRYIIKGINRVWYYDDDDNRRRGYIWSTAREGQNPVTDTLPSSIAISPNDPYEFDIDLTSVGEFATVSGTVRASGSSAPIAGALVEVDYGDGWVAPTNPNAKSDTDPEPEDDDIYETGSDGTYSIEVEAQGLGGSVSVRVTMDDMSFVPGMITSIPAHAGSAVTGFDFTGFLHARISGKVEAPGGGPLTGVTVTATRSDASAPAATVTTGRTGSFTLSVPFGTYTVEASLADHNFTYPTQHPGGIVNTAPGQVVNMGTIKATTAGALNVRATRQPGMDNDQTADVDESKTTWSNMTLVTYTANAEDVPVGYEDATYVIQTNITATDTEADWVDVQSPTAVQVDEVDVPGQFTITSPADSAFRVRVVASAVIDNNVTVTPPLTVAYEAISGTATVEAIDPSASGVTAKRGVRGTGDAARDTLGVAWTAVTTVASEHRVVIEIDHSGLESTVWLVAPTDGTVGTSIEDGSRTWVLTLPAAPVADADDPEVTGWTFAGTAGGNAPDVPRADLLKALNVRVDSRQNDQADFKAGSVVPVAAKPSS